MLYNLQIPTDYCIIAGTGVADQIRIYKKTILPSSAATTNGKMVFFIPKIYDKETKRI